MFAKNSLVRSMFNKNSNVVGGSPVGRVGLVLGLSALVAVPGFALAAPMNSDSSAGPSYQLRYSADDLRSAESVKALHVRIRRVALAYCPDYGVTKNLSERVSCIKDVESDLVSQVDHPLLTKIHFGDDAMSIAGTTR